MQHKRERRAKGGDSDSESDGGGAGSCLVFVASCTEPRVPSGEYDEGVPQQMKRPRFIDFKGDSDSEAESESDDDHWTELCTSDEGAES